MQEGLTVKTYDEESFKDMVSSEHEKGGFNRDDYRMQIDFSTVKECINFVGVSIEND